MRLLVVCASPPENLLLTPLKTGSPPSRLARISGAGAVRVDRHVLRPAHRLDSVLARVRHVPVEGELAVVFERVLRA